MGEDWPFIGRSRKSGKSEVEVRGWLEANMEQPMKCMESRIEYPSRQIKQLA